jgi:hypothetical protein
MLTFTKMATVINFDSLSVKFSVTEICISGKHVRK